MEINQFGFKTTATGNITDWDSNFVFIDDICDDHFDLYDYEDYLGVAHQILAMEWGLAD